MYNVDLETFYGRAKETIKVASVYVNADLFTKLITSCRLKPISIFNGTFRPGKLETWWVDEFGNSLLLKSNKLKTIKNDKNIKADTQISTDLFYGLSILNTAKISKTIVLIDGLLLFYGRDEYFRCFRKDGTKVSALEIDPDIILYLLQYIDYKHYSNSKLTIYGLPNAEIETILTKEYSRYE